MKKRKLHLITSLFITGIITLVISFNLNSHKEARKTNIILANIEALANMEWAQENLTTACRPCINTMGGWGVTFYCDYGQGDCYNTACINGYCF
ncbi:NVEALA domain-containing protein [Bacteroides fragilis]|uniref:NVEALA family protein n=1 Tax=Bacteroides fragilis str. 2-F-2 \|nr:NVEALA domain-containing protein [Bacteroides fragilis]EXY20624.1 NVEALA family protein [Bacteroides fragilis str. 2-F-2 \